jgi:exodeoxyribonuclease VII large subunit
LLALSPAATLRRGYAIVQRAEGTVVRSAAQVAPGEQITIRLAEDQLTAVVEAANQAAAGQGSTRDA